MAQAAVCEPKHFLESDSPAFNRNFSIVEQEGGPWNLGDQIGEATFGVRWLAMEEAVGQILRPDPEGPAMMEILWEAATGLGIDPPTE